MDSWGIGLTGGGGGGALGYFLGGYVPLGTPNWHPVLKKGRNPILLLSIQSSVCLIEVFNNRK